MANQGQSRWVKSLSTVIDVTVIAVAKCRRTPFHRKLIIESIYLDNMERRRFLQVVAISTISLAGCIGGDGLSTNSRTPRPTEVTETEFETEVTVDDGWSKPIIIVDRQNSTVTVEGIGQYGSSRCGYLDYQVDYSRENSLLRVTIVDKQEEPEKSEPPCEDDVSGSAYRVTVKFDEGVPSRIEAEHPFEKEATKKVN